MAGTNSPTDFSILIKIVFTWIACPLLGAVFALVLYQLAVIVFKRFPIHLLSIDFYTRWGLIIAGALGSYMLGANNIGNVVGIFLLSSPFKDLQIGNRWVFSSREQLFLLGGIAIALGVYTDSRRVMLTVGNNLMKLNPLAALVVVIAHSLVLFLFSSHDLANLLHAHNLPVIPLIPVSSSQAVIGAVIGIAFTKGIKGIRQVHWPILGEIILGWLFTPFLGTILSFLLLLII